MSIISQLVFVMFNLFMLLENKATEMDESKK